MKNLLVLLTMSGLLLPACSTTTWDKLEKGIAAGAVVTQKLQTGLAVAEKGVEAARAKLDELAAANAVMRENLEKIAGPMDADGDGKVSSAEAAAFMKKLSASPEGRDALLDWQTYAALAGAWVGWKGTKKGAAMVAKVTHVVGKEMVDRDGDGKPDVVA